MERIRFNRRPDVQWVDEQGRFGYFDATEDLTEKDRARINMYKLRENAAMRRNEIQQANKRKADNRELLKILLTFLLPTAFILLLVLIVRENFK